ncbi:MAG TPA: preprotein translocase subunit SecA [Anaerolineae bacterium]|nr:preprotein translocase subunit SecA [Anaerolineae bacterium]
MLKNLFHKVVGDPNSKELARLQPVVDEINALEPEFHHMPDVELRAVTDEFRARLAAETADLKAQLEAARAAAQAEEDTDARRRLDLDVKKLDNDLFKREESLLDEFLPRAFAAVRESARRNIGLRHFDVQLMGGMVLHKNKIAEMKTGEGKTLVATLPLYLNALLGHGAHLVTPNDYLSKFGAQTMGPVYHALGLSVGVIQHETAFRFDPDFKTEDDRFDRLRPLPRREAYAADITYGTNNEFGFDYLRDNMVWSLSQMVQRPLFYAIVDEVDNILIDEARTPLIISGPAEESSDNYRKFAELVRRLRPSTNGDDPDADPDGDYVVEEKTRNVTLSESGVEKMERAAGVDNLYSPENSALLPYLDNALRAHAVYKRDKDYIVKDGEVIIVDEFTGRLMYGRRYSEGLHQAIEAKEGVTVQRESLTYATVTFQNYFRMYRKLAGMTGTAKTEEEEFQKIYNLDVVVIPTNRPMIRDEYADVIYKTEAVKFKAVVNEIEELHTLGRPVLVGTVAIETSERLSGLLKRRGIPHNVLNAKEHEKEASVIAQAGRPATVTVATNMAGRGVDILLGGNPEGLAREALRRQGKDLTQVTREEWQAALAEAEHKCAEDKHKVIELGGLHILGTERHEARRIDNQLRGRAGRQGDPGSSRFYISLEDDLMRRFGGDRIKSVMDWAKMEEDVPLEHSLLSKSIEQAQTRVEGYNFDIRKHVLEYDDVVNKQREVIYAQRRKILTETNLRPIIFSMIEDEMASLAAQHTSAEHLDEWDVHALMSAARGMLPIDPLLLSDNWKGLNAEAIEAQLVEAAEKAYDRKARELGSLMIEAERVTLLRAVDSHWVRHLTDLDVLREGIGLRAYGQQNPLVAYKKEAFETFDEMNASIRSQVARDIFRVQAQPAPVSAPASRPLRTNAPMTTKGQKPVRKAVDAIGRNDPCPCGSGKKYKHCHGQAGAPPLPAAASVAAAKPIRKSPSAGKS